VEEDFSFLYGKKYGWAVRFRIKDKLLACLYPNTNYFITQVILSTQNLSETRINNLHANASQAIKIAKPYPEGKWIFMRTESKQDIDDIKMLLNLKTPKKQKNLKI
jgi:hypothetical protein